MVDFYGGGFMIFALAVLEVVAISYVYGMRRVLEDVKFMLGLDYVFLIFSQFSQIFSHKRNRHKKKLRNFAKLQFLNDKIDQLQSDKWSFCIGRSQTTFTRRGRYKESILL